MLRSSPASVSKQGTESGGLEMTVVAEYVCGTKPTHDDKRDVKYDAHG
jgi:hypothetical protein